MVDDTSAPHVKAEIEINSGFSAIFKRLTRYDDQGAKILELNCQYSPDYLYLVHLEKFSGTVPHDSVDLYSGPDPFTPSNYTLKGIVTSLPPNQSPVKSLFIEYIFGKDWGQGEIDEIHVKMMVSAGGDEPNGEDNIHGAWPKMIRWRLKVEFPNSVSSKSAQYVPYSWAKWVHFPMINFDVPGEDQEHWFMITEMGRDWFHGACCDNPFLLTGATEVLRESYTLHPGGHALSQEEPERQLLQYKGWYMADYQTGNHFLPPAGRLFFFATDDMWGHQKRFMLRMIRMPEPGGGKNGGNAGKPAVPLPTGKALFQTWEDYKKVLDKYLSQGRVTGGTKGHPDWWTGRETVEFWVEHYGNRAFNKAADTSSDRSPFSMVYNDPTKALPCYSVYTGILKCKSDAYWYDACEKYKEFIKAVPSSVSGLTPTLYSLPLSQRTNWSRIHTDGSVYLAWACDDNSSVQGHPSAENMYGNGYDRDLLSWVAFFQKDAPGFPAKNFYCHVQHWAVRGDGMGKGGLLHQVYTGTYPRSPVRDLNPNGAHQDFGKYVRKWSGVRYKKIDPSTWTPLGARVHPYNPLDEIISLDLEQEIDHTNASHPLQNNAYVLRPWMAGSSNARWVPGNPSGTLFLEPGQLCLGLDRDQMSPARPWVRVEYHVRDLGGVKVHDTANNCDRFFFQCTGIYTDHLSGPGGKLCDDDGSAQGSNKHAHLLRPGSLCAKEKYPAPGGAYYIYGRKLLEARAREVGNQRIVAQMNDKGGSRRVNTDDKFYLLAEAPEEYNAGGLDLVGQWVGIPILINYFHTIYHDPSPAGTWRTWRNQIFPPVFSLVYHDRMPIGGLITRDTLSPILESYDPASNNKCFNDSQFHDWIDFMCLARGLEIVQGAQTVTLYRNFRSYEGIQNPRPCKWSNWLHHPMIRGNSPSSVSYYTFPTKWRTDRSKEVWEKFLAYLCQLWDFRLEFPWVTDQEMLRPVERVWYTNQDPMLNMTVTNPAVSVESLLAYLAGTTMPWASKYQPFRDYTTPQGSQFNNVDHVLTGTFQLGGDDEGGFAVLFTNWSKDDQVGATFQFLPEWYGVQGKSLNSFWAVWSPYPQSPTGYWELFPGPAVSFQAGVPVKVTLYKTGLQGSGEILFKDSTGIPRGLRPRELTALIFSPNLGKLNGGKKK